jgi:predicted ArsR family transcriptional regulator
MARADMGTAIIAYLQERHAVGLPLPSSSEIAAHLAVPRPTVIQHISRLVQSGALLREGAGPATRYRLSELHEEASQADRDGDSLVWSDDALKVRAILKSPLASRAPVTYQREFVEEYRPQQTHLLPLKVATELLDLGRMKGQAPAGAGRHVRPARARTTAHRPVMVLVTAGRKHSESP